jgi:hypothetical protein
VDHALPLIELVPLTAVIAEEREKAPAVTPAIVDVTAVDV